MALTSKQEAFAQAIADGNTQSDAYRKAYDADGMADTAIHVNASKLMKNTKVAQRVAELKAKLEVKAIWTREMSVQALVGVINSSDKGTEIVSAVKELNSMHGYEAPKKTDLRVSGGLVLVPSKDGWE